MNRLYILTWRRRCPRLWFIVDNKALIIIRVLLISNFRQCFICKVYRKTKYFHPLPMIGIKKYEVGLCQSGSYVSGKIVQLKIIRIIYRNVILVLFFFYKSQPGWFNLVYINTEPCNTELKSGQNYCLNPMKTTQDPQRLRCRLPRFAIVALLRNSSAYDTSINTTGVYFIDS